jgi:hypothetical protein
MNAPAAGGRLRIEVPRAARRRGRSVVTAAVDGEPLWFESTDARLEASIEAFASTLLIPAAGRGLRLAGASPISPLWLRNHERRVHVLDGWWQLAPDRPELVAGVGAERRRPRRRTALAFSGGVDSLHALRAGGRRIDAILTVHGFDIALGDAERADHAERSMREIARALRIEPIVVRTNLREHPALDASDWGQVHGGALAGVGHLLVRRVGRLLVAASWPYDNDAPWGSHWRLDSLWSSERLEVAHVGAELWRSDKVRELAGDPLAHRHLRVCWESLVGTWGNCGRCEKCVRTMLVLEQAGRLGDFSVFDREESLAVRVAALPAVGAHIAPVYAELLDRGLAAETAAAVSALLERSGSGDRAPAP